MWAMRARPGTEQEGRIGRYDGCLLYVPLVAQDMP